MTTRKSMVDTVIGAAMAAHGAWLFFTVTPQIVAEVAAIGSGAPLVEIGWSCAGVFLAVVAAAEVACGVTLVATRGRLTQTDA